MLNEFILLTIAHVIAVASPGADFAVVLKNTLASGKSIGSYTAIGVGAGISVHLVYTLLGIALILSQSPMIFTIIKFCGAVYLLWLAWLAFHSRAKKSTDSRTFKKLSLKPVEAFRQGFLTNVFNPKVTIFFLVLFTNIVSSETPMLIQSLYGVWLVIYTMLWFVIVAWTFSRRPVLRWYESHGHFVDWGMGAFLTFIALKLIFFSSVI